MKCYHHLTKEKRYTISALLQAGKSKKEIATIVGVSRSTVHRELSRNSREENYNDDEADKKYRARRKRCHRKEKMTGELLKTVLELLSMKWSPEQISGRLELEKKGRMSHQTIYNFIFADRQKGGLIYKGLRRKKKYGKRKTKETRGQIKDRKTIAERPAIVDAKERMGDWELDTIVSRKDKTTIVTAVERKSRFVVTAKIGARNARSVARALVNHLNALPFKVLTMTSDNGKEFAMHKSVSRKLQCDFFFAIPHHPWERGCNENTNGLLREYLPKGESFRQFTKREIQNIATQLNNRPRKCLNYLTPAEVFFNSSIVISQSVIC